MGGEERAMTLDEHLARRFARMASTLHDTATVAETHRLVTEAALATVTGCEHAAISLLDRHGGVVSVAATDVVPAAVDRIQYETGHGPCLNAITTQERCALKDLATDDIWADFSRPAAALGVRSMLSFPLSDGHETLGALNLYADAPDAFDAYATELGAVLAVHAGLAMAHARSRERCAELEQALGSSREIGMALGVVMASRGVTSDVAFDMLRRASRRQNRKVREIAADVVETGQTP
jgi:GAF domain-containing protein